MLVPPPAFIEVQEDFYNVEFDNVLYSASFSNSSIASLIAEIISHFNWSVWILDEQQNAKMDTRILKITINVEEYTNWAGILSCLRTKLQVPVGPLAGEPQLLQRQSLQCSCHLEEEHIG